jgi:hypothetical protein
VVALSRMTSNTCWRLTEGVIAGKRHEAETACDARDNAVIPSDPIGGWLGDEASCQPLFAAKMPRRASRLM